MQQFEQADRRLDERTSLLGALGHASKVHEAGIDNLTHAAARVEDRLVRLEDGLAKVEDKTEELCHGQSRLESEVREIVDTNKSLLEMYGEHEAKIRTMRRQ